MNMEGTSPAKLGPLSPLEQLRLARQIIDEESRALACLSSALGGEFCKAVEIIRAQTGSVIVSGMGKAGLVGQKITATLASTGTPAHFLHPAEAIHGDLGRIRPDDTVLMLSQSGETEEVVRLMPILADMGVPIIALTAGERSTLGRGATVVLPLGDLKEACTLGLAPSTSTTVMLALGDALALVLSRMEGFGPENFARFHPGGSLGRKLSLVEEHMRPVEQCRIATTDLTIREVLVGSRRAGRRTGATMLVDTDGLLAGIFTDSDLARLLENRDETLLDRPISDVMTREPLRVTAGTRMAGAVDLMARRKISELPVVDDENRPVGLIDITDLIDHFPQPETESPVNKQSTPTEPPSGWNIIGRTGEET